MRKENVVDILFIVFGFIIIVLGILDQDILVLSIGLTLMLVGKLEKILEWCINFTSNGKDYMTLNDFIQKNRKR